MSKKHPVVAVTGSSGAGTTTVKRAFEQIFRRENINPAIIEGDSFHSLDRMAFREAVKKAEASGNNNFSHFGPEANHFDKLAELFKAYGKNGGGKKRYYLHSDEEAAEHNARLSTTLKAGEFTPWEDIAEGSDLLFYEGLHGAVVTPTTTTATKQAVVVVIIVIDVVGGGGATRRRRRRCRVAPPTHASHGGGEQRN